MAMANNYCYYYSYTHVYMNSMFTYIDLFLHLDPQHLQKMR